MKNSDDDAIRRGEEYATYFKCGAIKTLQDPDFVFDISLWRRIVYRIHRRFKRILGKPAW